MPLFSMAMAKTDLTHITLSQLELQTSSLVYLMLMVTLTKYQNGECSSPTAPNFSTLIIYNCMKFRGIIYCR